MTIRFDFRDLNRVLHRLTGFVATETMQAVAPIVKTDIKDQTLSGRDADNQGFAPYVPDYAKTRSKKGLQTSPVNLKVTGHLLENIRDEGNRVSVPKEMEGQAEGLMKKRKWLGIGRDTITKIERVLVRKINNLT